VIPRAVLIGFLPALMLHAQSPLPVGPILAVIESERRTTADRAGTEKQLRLLSYPSLSGEEEKQIRSFPGEVKVIGWRDAIIAATAMVEEAELFTNDRKTGRVPELKVRALTLKDATPH
jgi:predicted nucleic acid-binding protein